jgi:MOSC domain-containing protein YiiM
MPARIVSLQLCPGHRVPMQRVSSASLLTGIGLEGDTHARASSNRQVLLADEEGLDLLGLLPGIIKENITVEGLGVMRLPPGTRLRVGAGAVLEITSVCEPCHRIDEIRHGLRRALDRKRGMNSRVIVGGPIAVGDPIRVETHDMTLS